MNVTKHPVTGRASRAVDAVVVDGASARLAKLTRDAALLEADALHWADTGNAAFAIGCAAEAAAMRAEARRLADAKFTQRARPRTVTFEREPARVARASRRLTEHAERLMTKNGRTRFAEAFHAAAGRALDDLLAIGRRKADRAAGSMTNRGARVH